MVHGTDLLNVPVSLIILGVAFGCGETKVRLKPVFLKKLLQGSGQVRQKQHKGYSLGVSFC